jgi:hypothetical protein
MLLKLWRRWLQSLALTLLIFVMGCAGAPPRPPTAEPSPAPTNSPAPATPTIEVLPTATPASYVRLKNAKSGAYLYDADGHAQLAELSPSDPAFEWAIEDYQGSKRIWNRASGNYLSIEHLQPYVEIIPIYPEWMSPRWTFETDKTTGSFILRNVWHNWQILYVKDGRLKYDRFPTLDDAAHWLFESSDGTALAESTATPVVVLPTAAQPADSRGASVPWVEYEAEKSRSTGEILAPDRTFGTLAAEASGRSAVKLDKTGEYLQFRATKAANSVVVRYVIPDSEDGSGQTATLSLYVNNAFRQKIQLTSKYAWSYGGEQLTLNTPKAGGAHHFYDEARALVDDLPAGATIKLQKDADDSADYYVIDLIDLEQVAPPKEMPAGYLSIVTDCGATPDDGRDDGAAIQTCIDRARAAKTGVWIPAGTFDSTTHPFEVADVTLQGAGMWYATIHGLYARFNCVGNNCRYFDFAILGETLLRDDKSPENGFNGGAGTGSRLENIWVEHTKVGYWVGPGASNGLIILNSRFRNLFADGVNFCNGTSNSVVENSHFRNTGDDALASWSPQGSGVNTNNVFRFNTVQAPWRANCYAIYGGQDNRIEDNVCADVVTYPGILVAQDFNSNPFAGTTRIERNTLLRAGGPMFRQEHGALKLQAAQEVMHQIVVKDILIDSPTFSGIELEGRYALQGITFENIRIVNPGTWGIHILSDVTGDVTFTKVTVSHPGKDGLLNYAPSLYFTLTKGTGNSGW